MPTLSPLAGRIAAIGLLLLLLAAIWTVAVAPVFGRMATHASAVDALENQILRTRQLIARGGELEAQLQSLRSNQGAARLLIQAQTPPLAGAALQRQVNGIVQKHQARVTSAQVVRPTPEGGLQKISARYALTGNIRQLQRVLYDLETASPVLIVDSLTIRARGQEPAPDAQLTVDLQVAGYMR